MARFNSSTEGPLPAALYPASAVTSPRPENVVDLLSSWIARFNQVLHADMPLDELFFEESYWRDHLTFSWEFRTLKGPRSAADFIDTVRGSDGSVQAHVRLDVGGPEGLRPQIARIDQHGKINGVVASIHVDTPVGYSRGYLRLLQDARDGKWKIFTLFTTLQEIKGYPERVRHARPIGREGRNDTRFADEATSSRNTLELAVLIVGMSSTGLEMSSTSNFRVGQQSKMTHMTYRRRASRIDDVRSPRTAGDVELGHRPRDSGGRCMAPTLPSAGPARSSLV